MIELLPLRRRIEVPGASLAVLAPIHGFGGISEPFSALTHLLGAAMFLVLGVLLVGRARGHVGRQVYLGIYAFSCVLLMTMSGLYHTAATGGTAHRVFQRLDHAAIFVLIAGTFTPIHGLLFRGAQRWLTLTLIWTIALGGVALKAAYADVVAEWVSLPLYLGLGWAGTVSGILLWRQRGFGFIRPLLYGGVAYSVGAVLEFFRWPVAVPGIVHAHEVFHVAVLIGALLHFIFIWRFAQAPVEPVPAATPRDEPSPGRLGFD